MKNKEERMVIVKTNPKDGTACPLLDVSNEMAPVCALDNSVPYCKECRKGITRAEAVKRMAKAMAANDVGGYIILAEAALDALLGKGAENVK